ncbi:general stress protein [Hymenobacter sp.]|uniref:general stress protein n=1 Tax=Hymenobacter sp. TaxID=1898978 RepID=UPI00286A926F|nr:hypothetical protein [Hymenobacter sp.]
MKKHSPMVAAHDTHELAEQAVRRLQHRGYNMRQLSIVGRDYHTEETVVGYYNAGDRMQKWKGRGAWPGGGRRGINGRLAARAHVLASASRTVSISGNACFRAWLGAAPLLAGADCGSQRRRPVRPSPPPRRGPGREFLPTALLSR